MWKRFTFFQDSLINRTFRITSPCVERPSAVCINFTAFFLVRLYTQTSVRIKASQILWLCVLWQVLWPAGWRGRTRWRWNWAVGPLLQTGRLLSGRPKWSTRVCHGRARSSGRPSEHRSGQHSHGKNSLTYINAEYTQKPSISTQLRITGHQVSVG